MWKHRFKKDVNSFAVLRQKTTILIRSYELNEAAWVGCEELCR